MDLISVNMIMKIAQVVAHQETLIVNPYVKLKREIANKTEDNASTIVIWIVIMHKNKDAQQDANQ